MYIISNTNKNKFVQIINSKPAITININDAQMWDKEEKINNYLNNLSNSIKKKDVWEVYSIDATPDFYNITKIHNSNIHNTNTQSINKRVQFKTDIRKLVYRKTEGHCALCGNFVDYEDYTIDHIVPLSKGGTNDINNLQCACKVCNNIKTDILPDEFMDKISQILVHNMNNNYDKIIGKKLSKMIFKAKFKLC